MNNQPNPHHRRNRLIKAVLTLGWMLALAVLIFTAVESARDNLHTVSPGQFYRSSQMGDASLRSVIQEKGIKTIVNLRGKNEQPWYYAETNVSQLLGVKHFDFPLSASEQLNNAQMDEIVTTLRTAPKPILVHCKSGADRTGLISALYLYSLEGKTAAVADNELTIWSGHFPYLFWRSTAAMDDSFWRYVNAHTPTNFVSTNISAPAAQ